jgi:membrane-associated phospholipid phosphatase
LFAKAERGDKEMKENVMRLACAFAVSAGLPLLAQVEPNAGTWKTWVLTSAREILTAPPPSQAEATGELAWLKSYLAQSRQSAEAMKQMRIWTAGPPSYRWVERMLNLIETRGFSNSRNARNLALLNVAMYDATIATWNAKYTHNRARPSVADPGIQPSIATPHSPSYPSEHAATAGAAAEILAYLYPADAQAFRYLSEEAARAALTAGINYPSDMIAGLQLGRAVGAKVVAMAQNDGSQAVWTGSVPTGSGFWVGVAPLEPLAGTWRTWVLTSGAQLRPGPPVPYDSPQKRAELEEIKNYPRTFASNAKGFFYQSLEGVFRVFYDELSQRILENNLSENAPAAARAYALAGIAHNDGSVACWDAKYTYWAPRPNQLDSSITTLFTQPGHPSYPSAHGCFSGAVARVIGRLFPDYAQLMEERSAEAVESRLWSGIHFRSDIDVGLAIGRRVGDLVIERAASDGSLP